MRPNGFEDWLKQRMQAPAPTPKQDRLQLAASTQAKTLAPIINQELNTPGLYLPQPQAPAYHAPVAHARILTHQAPHRQNPDTTTPDVGSLYLLPVQPLGK